MKYWYSSTRLEPLKECVMFTSLFCMKVVVILLLAVDAYYIYRAVSLGLYMKRFGKNPELIEKKKNLRDGIICMTGVALVCLIGMKELPMFHANPPYRPLFFIHEGFAACLGVTLMLMSFWLTGEKHPVAHGRLVRVFIWCSVVVVPIGLFLLYQM